MKIWASALLLVLVSLPALAGTAEVREVARINNCAPKKIEVYQQALGLDGKTTYRVQCTLPKATGEDANAKPPDALLIGCNSTLCEMMRPVSMDKK